MHRSLTSRALAAPGPSPSHRSRVRPAVAVVALATALLVAACGSDGSGSASPAPTDLELTTTTAAPSTTTTAPPLTPDQAVLDAIAGYWSTFFEANDPPDPSHPGFARYYTGEALAKSTANAQNRLEVGTAVRRGDGQLFESRPTIVELAEDAAIVEDCVIDDSTLVERATGKHLNDSVETNLMRLTLERYRDGWKVASNTVLASTPGANSSCG